MGYIRASPILKRASPNIFFLKKKEHKTHIINLKTKSLKPINHIEIATATTHHHHLLLFTLHNSRPPTPPPPTAVLTSHHRRRASATPINHLLLFSFHSPSFQPYRSFSSSLSPSSSTSFTATPHRHLVELLLMWVFPFHSSVFSFIYLMFLFWFSF